MSIFSDLAELKTLEQIQVEVGQWSLANFGNQQSKFNDAILNEISPLLGLMEEAGEYSMAKTKEESLDALGDMMIYLCDFACRDGAYLIIPDHTIHVIGYPQLITSIGMLCHVVLKRHQGIRGYDNPLKYINDRDIALIEIMWKINLLCTKAHSTDTLDVLNNTWKSVNKRDWKCNPENAGEEV